MIYHPLLLIIRAFSTWFLGALFCAHGIICAQDAVPTSQAAVAELFRKQPSRSAFLQAAGRAMAADVPAQAIAEAKMNYGLDSGDSEYLIQNLPYFEKVLKTFDTDSAIKYRAAAHFAEKVEFVRELRTAQAPVEAPAKDAEDRIDALERQLQMYQLLLAEADATSAAPPSAPNPALGDPNLRSKVTRTSLGKAFVPGMGWLPIGPNGPIDIGKKQQVGKVNTREEVRAREMKKAAAAAGMSVEAYATMLQSRAANMSRDRLSREINDLSQQLRMVRGY